MGKSGRELNSYPIFSVSQAVSVNAAALLTIDERHGAEYDLSFWSRGTMVARRLLCSHLLLQIYQIKVDACTKNNLAHKQDVSV